MSSFYIEPAVCKWGESLKTEYVDPPQQLVHQTKSLNKTAFDKNKHRLIFPWESIIIIIDLLRTQVNGTAIVGLEVLYSMLWRREKLGGQEEKLLLHEAMTALLLRIKSNNAAVRDS